jgi:hypothetical protein
MENPVWTLTPAATPIPRPKMRMARSIKCLCCEKEVMELNTLKDLYIHELKDLYSAEKQLIKAIPKMEKAAKNTELATGFQEHLERIRLTNYTADHGAGLLGLLSVRPCGGREFSDSVNWKVAQPWQD